MLDLLDCSSNPCGRFNQLSTRRKAAWQCWKFPTRNARDTKESVINKTATVRCVELINTIVSVVQRVYVLPRQRTAHVSTILLVGPTPAHARPVAFVAAPQSRGFDGLRRRVHARHGRRRRVGMRRHGMQGMDSGRWIYRHAISRTGHRSQVHAPRHDDDIDEQNTFVLQMSCAEGWKSATMRHAIQIQWIWSVKRTCTR